MPLDEAAAAKRISDTVISSGAALFTTTKYIYAMSKDNFYSVDVKDIFKVVLNNVRIGEKLDGFHIPLDAPSISPLDSERYDAVFPLIVYSFAVRLPELLSRQELSEQTVKGIYNDIIKKGAQNKDGAVPEEFGEIKALVKKGKQPPPYNADWLKSYLYAAFPELAEVSNRNFFFFGALDVLFVMFFLNLEARINGLLSPGAA
jgi:hypothetical protein